MNWHASVNWKKWYNILWLTLYKMDMNNALSLVCNGLRVYSFVRTLFVILNVVLCFRIYPSCVTEIWSALQDGVVLASSIDSLRHQLQSFLFRLSFFCYMDLPCGSLDFWTAVKVTDWLIDWLWCIQGQTEADNVSLSASGNVHSGCSNWNDWTSGTCCCQQFGLYSKFRILCGVQVIN